MMLRLLELLEEFLDFLMMTRGCPTSVWLVYNLYLALFVPPSCTACMSVDDELYKLQMKKICCEECAIMFNTMYE